MRFIRPLAIVVPAFAALVLGACGDTTAPTPRIAAPAAPTAIISDGSRAGGNPDFFFLPPVVANPSNDPDFSAGQFVSSWKPVVRVCEVSAANLAAGCIGGIVRTYSGAAVTVSSAAEQYQVQVDSKEAWAVAGSTFRFTVSVVGTQPVDLGFVDIALLTGSAKNVNTGDVVTMQDGRTIPLKFRIEKGATVDASVGVFSETSVTDAGATILTGGTGGPGTFALALPADFLPAGLDQVVIVVEKLSTGAGGECVASVPNLIQSSDCWRVTSYPEIPRVTQDLTVAFCPAISASDPRYEAQAMYKFDAPETLAELANVATTLVNCNPSSTIGAAPREPGLLGALQYGLATLGRGISKAFGPNTAYAIDLGWGGRIASTEEDVAGGVFSDFFWAIPLRVDVLSGNGQSGYTGLPLGEPVSVRVTGAHVHANQDDGPISIPGISVTFAPGAGSVGATTVVTNSDGVASTTWTLGSAAGTQSMTAGITSVGSNLQQTFTATATQAITTGAVVSCGGALYLNGQGLPTGDLLDRGFHVPGYAGTSLAGVDLRLIGEQGTVGTVTLTAYDGGYDGPVLGTTSTSFAIPTGGSTLASFVWPQPINTTPGHTVAFAMSPAPAGLFYNVANSFTPGDASCPIVQTNGTEAPLSTFRRQGVAATIFASLPVIP
jgi:hypothetical protein